MKPSRWLYLAAGCLAAMGLLAWWPFLIVAVFTSCGAYIQHQAEKKAAIRTQYAHTRRS
jgi:hypothetical protein